MLKQSLIIRFTSFKLIFASLILPSLLLPVRFSSLMLIVATLVIFLNFFSKKKDEIFFNKYLMIPFLIYFLSVVVSFLIDLSKNIVEFEFLMRNLTILIIPLFIFTSNFSKSEILKILKKTSIFITIIGCLFLFVWFFGYLKFKHQQEYQKKDWFKKEVVTNANYVDKSSNFEIIIPYSSQKPSLRKVIMLSKNQSKNNLIREFLIKVNKSNKDVWVLLRNIDGNNCKAWFNASTGAIGNLEGKAIVEAIEISNQFYKFTLKNKPKDFSTREWFYISFVDNNGSYKWSNNNQEVVLELKSPNLYLENRENLLLTNSIFKYRITEFSNLETYSHATYFGLVFLFALVFLIFNSFYNSWIRFILIIINIIVIITLGSKAIIISFAIFIPIYYLVYNLKNRWIVLALVFGFFFTFYSQINQRFNQMFQTIVNIKQSKEMGDLETLSTNNRILIYKNYVSLIKKNFDVGYGYKNGEQLINSKFSHNFNAHNQYFQSIFNSGILGILSLIIFCFFPFFIKRKNDKKRYGFVFFMVMIIFNFLFESLLFRQWGLIIVSFSFSIYYQFIKKKY